jgi:hypothetical protein
MRTVVRRIVAAIRWWNVKISEIMTRGGRIQLPGSRCVVGAVAGNEETEGGGDGDKDGIEWVCGSLGSGCV